MGFRGLGFTGMAYLDCILPAIACFSPEMRMRFAVESCMVLPLLQRALEESKTLWCLGNRGKTLLIMGEKPHLGFLFKRNFDKPALLTDAQYGGFRLRVPHVFAIFCLLLAHGPNDTPPILWPHTC